MSNTQYLQLSNPFHLETGGTLAKPTIAYNTYGTLNAAKNNVIVIVHALTANTVVPEWWGGLFGQSNVFDPEKYFIVCANNLGSPYGTTSPKHSDPTTGERYGLQFPFFTIRDTAKLHIHLLKHLGIEQIHLMIGGSCGGNIAQEMAIEWDEKIDNLVLLCCSAVESAWAIAIHESQRITLKIDPTFQENTPTAGQAGLKAARAIALPYYRSHPSFKIRQAETDLNKLKDFKAASYIDYQGVKFVNRFDVHCYYLLMNTLDTHNVGRGRESVESALAKITAKTVCIGFDTDLLVPKIEQQFLAQHIPNAEYAEIETLFGHDAFLIESEQIKKIIQQNIYNVA